MSNTIPVKKQHGGKREGAKRPKKYSCDLVQLQTTIPEPSRQKILEFIESEREKYLVHKEEKLFCCT